MTWTGPHTVLERFLRYVQIDTESDAAQLGTPSTQKQFDLAKLLASELKEMGATEVECDAHAYVYATIPATVQHAVPVVCWCSHMDTSPDVTGANVKPQVHDYTGKPIVISAAANLQLSEKEMPYLAEHRGHQIVTASGDTLLGADDKAGVSIIMDAARYLLAHPELKHGKIRVLFTPDEEIGRGVDEVDMQKLGADFGYTLDGAEAGTLEGETFSADGATITVTGISAHPGYAKGKLLNALRVAAYLVDQLPKNAHSPETTSGRDGFVHLVQMSGTAETTTLNFIIRDFETPRLDIHYKLLETASQKAEAAFPGAKIAISRQEQYRNLGETLVDHPEVMAYANEAIRRIGLSPKQGVIRGGTDGSRLSFMGLPCPNLFTGMQMIHSRREWIGVRDMELAAKMLVELAQVWAEKSK